jgi:hypothetical protein
MVVLAPGYGYLGPADCRSNSSQAEATVLIGFRKLARQAPLREAVSHGPRSTLLPWLRGGASTVEGSVEAGAPVPGATDEPERGRLKLGRKTIWRR